MTNALVKSGYEVFSIQQMMQGIDDLEIIEVAAKKNGYILNRKAFRRINKSFLCIK